jgi:hypothetical protein
MGRDAKGGSVSRIEPRLCALSNNRLLEFRHDANAWITRRPPAEVVSIASLADCAL